jgi:FMN-dependent NADH-azoreductase
MAKLIFVQASPRSTQSKSIEIAEVYLDTLRAANPELEIDRLDLWEADLPAFDGDKVAAKLNALYGKDQNAAQQTAWDQIVGIASRFISADRYLFAVPMWNLGVPYRLKQYIDIIHQPGLLFGFKPETGYFGLLKDKHATLVLTSGVFAQSLPSPAYGEDHQSTYLRSWLNEAGVTAIDELRFQPTILTSDPTGDLERVRHDAGALARAHGHIRSVESKV